MDIKTDYDNGVERLIDFLKQRNPNLNETEIFLIKSHVRSIVAEQITNIGNYIHSLPKQIRN